MDQTCVHLSMARRKPKLAADEIVFRFQSFPLLLLPFLSLDCQQSPWHAKKSYVLWFVMPKITDECGKVTRWIKAPEYDPQAPDENQFLELVL